MLVHTHAEHTLSQLLTQKNVHLITQVKQQALRVRQIEEKAERQENAANEGADEEVQEYASIAASGLPNGADAASAVLSGSSASLFGSSDNKGDGKKPAVGQALEASVSPSSLSVCVCMICNGNARISWSKPVVPEHALEAALCSLCLRVREYNFVMRCVFLGGGKTTHTHIYMHTRTCTYVHNHTCTHAQKEKSVPLQRKHNNNSAANKDTVNSFIRNNNHKNSNCSSNNNNDDDISNNNNNNIISNNNHNHRNDSNNNHNCSK
jgi:hypothetical protein